MNLNKCIERIRSNLIIASAKRKKLLAGLPVLRKQSKELRRELDGIEKEIEKINQKYYNDDHGNDWELVLDVLDNDAYKVERRLAKVNEGIENGEYALGGIEDSIEAASYDAVDAAKA